MIRVLNDITCHKCGDKFKVTKRNISYWVYECPCGQQIRKSTGYKYEG